MQTVEVASYERMKEREYILGDIVKKR